MPRRGENIRKRKDGRWEARYIRRYNSDGKAIYSSVYGKTYFEVKKKQTEMLNKLSTEALPINDHEIKFREVLFLWLNNNRIKLKDQTYAKYLYLIENHIIPKLGSTSTATTGNIMGGYGKQYREEGRVNYDLKETSDGWHYFGMNWQPDGYVFYCDGEEVSRCNDNVSHVPQFILLTTEVQGYRSNNPKRVEGTFVDDAFIVDFVRVFDKE